MGRGVSTLLDSRLVSRLAGGSWGVVLDPAVAGGITSKRMLRSEWGVDVVTYGWVRGDLRSKMA